MGQLRERMAADIELRGLSKSTLECYLGAIRSFARYYMRSPAEMGIEEVRGYLLHLAQERKLAPSTIGCCAAALKFLSNVDVALGLSVEQAPGMLVYGLYAWTGLVATVLGTATFLVSLPFSAAGGNVGEAAEHLVMKPAKATFVRCLGCKNQRRYQDPDE